MPSHYYRCPYCRSRYHASEGGCSCLDDHGQCHGCKPNRFFHGSDNLYADEGWHHINELTEFDGIYFCVEHRVCGCCHTERSEGGLSWDIGADMLLCPKCSEDDHYCEKDGPLLDHIAKKTGSEDA